MRSSKLQLNSLCFGLNPWHTKLKARMLTITTPIRIGVFITLNTTIITSHVIHSILDHMYVYLIIFYLRYRENTVIQSIISNEWCPDQWIINITFEYIIYIMFIKVYSVVIMQAAIRVWYTIFCYINRSMAIVVSYPRQCFTQSPRSEF